MYLGNFVTHAIFGFLSGMLLCWTIHSIFYFAILYICIDLITLVIFQRKDFKKFREDVKKEEGKAGVKAKVNPTIVWVLFRIMSALLIFVVAAFVGLGVKRALVFLAVRYLHGEVIISK